MPRLKLSRRERLINIFKKVADLISRTEIILRKRTKYFIVHIM